MIHSDSLLKIAPDEGTRVPLYYTGIGKIFMANMTVTEMKHYFDNTTLTSETENTIVHPDDLKSQIAVIKTENVAFEKDEFMMVSTMWLRVLLMPKAIVLQLWEFQDLR